MLVHPNSVKKKLEGQRSCQVLVLLLTLVYKCSKLPRIFVLSPTHPVVECPVHARQKSVYALNATGVPNLETVHAASNGGYITDA